VSSNQSAARLAASGNVPRVFRVNNARPVRPDASSSVAKDPQLPSGRCALSRTVPLTEGCERRASKAEHVGSRAVWTEPRRKGQPPPESRRPLRQAKRRLADAFTEPVSARNPRVSKFPALRPVDSSPGRGASGPGVLPGLRGVTSRWVDLRLARRLSCSLYPWAIAGTGDSALFPVPCRSPPGLLQEQLRTLFDFFAFRASTSALAGRAWQEHRHVRLGMVLAASQSVARTFAYLVHFFLSPASSRRLPGDGGAPLRVAPVWCRARRLWQEHLRTLFNFFSPGIARASIQQAGGTNCQRCCDVG
jgi:hypothetical protein